MFIVKPLFKSLIVVIILLSLLQNQKLYSQNNTPSGITYIENLIENDSVHKAENQLNKRIAFFKSQKNTDSLITYIPLVGSFKLANGNSEIAIEKAETFVDELKQLNSAAITVAALIELSNIYFDARLHNKNYEICKEALRIINKTKGINPLKISDIEYNLGTVLLNLGNNKEGKEHLYKSKKILEIVKPIRLQKLYNTYNSIGRVQSNLTQIDSSTFYYKEALATLDKMSNSEINRDYWRAIVNNNISLNFQNTGKTDEAIKYITDAILDFQKFMNVAKNESRKLRAKRYRLTTIDNLATFYEGIGNFNRAIDLLTYSYKEKQKFLKEDDSNIVFSLVLLGHINLKIKDYKKAAFYSDKALEQINKNPDNHSFLYGFTLTIRASIYESVNDFEGAKKLYQESEALYNKTFDGNYSKDYLDALIVMSRFYTKKNENEKAIELALIGYNFTKNKQFENDLIQFHHTQNLADVYLGLKKYNEALKYSEEALAFFKDSKLNIKTFADSIQNEYIKPRAILVNAKSKYNLKEDKNTTFLKVLLSQMEEGIAILERRKINTKTVEDLNLLIEENNDLFNFVKQIKLDLYNKTQNKSHLLDLITVHESSLYNRIRSRLNLKDNTSFINIPEKIIKRETYLKNNLNASLYTSQNTIASFFDATNNWNQFLDSLKKEYPKYYKMRYATIAEPINKVQSNIPKNTTIVRYLFIEDNLYAFIINADNQDLVSLEFEPVKNHIQKLNENQFDIENVSQNLYELYKQLWKPFNDKITTENVIIIPDRELFNLSFEALTPNKINTFKALANNSLLANYNISYNYSLLLLNKYKKVIDYKRDFIAFAPEFTDAMKKEYELKITDSINLDKTYLTLLPQPFSKDLVEKYTRLFSGESFLNEKALKQLFADNVKEHKIIHIGSHAESNNVSPELSRLVFAKNISNSESINNNYLYTYEIYNQNLSSNLAILTACETGKPTYQAGEGMISLAHAFNYAGSESILTSLWKIDEQSSSEIIQSFYNYLSKGLTKNEALRKAKLDYLSNAEGRILSPQYWAGLILIGDTSPIELQTNSNNIFYWLISLLTLILLIIIVLNVKKKT